MYLVKSLVALMAPLFTLSLASPAPQGSSQATQASTTPNVPIPDFSTLVNDPDPPQLIGVDKVDECSESSFLDQTTNASPRIEDCLQIAANIATGGRWEVEATVDWQHQIVQYRTCAFGVKGYNGGDWFFYIGNEDIIDTIHTSIEQFGRDGLVGTKGTMYCHAITRSLKVDWGLYHTKSFLPRDSSPTSANDAAASDLSAPTDTARVPDFSTPIDDTQPAIFSSGDKINLCGESTFVNQNSRASPLIADCLHITANIADGGQWEVAVGRQHQLVQYGTCAFGVSGCCGDVFFYIGNEDIINIIHDSIDKFGWNGVIGATGQMRCDAAALPPRVDWGLYHTKSSMPRGGSLAESLSDTSVRNLPAPSNDTSPIPDFATPANDTHPGVSSASDKINECGESTFENWNSEASPKIEDCRHVVANIAGGGRWEVEAFVGQQHQLLQWGTCAFGVRGGSGDTFFYIGNEDIIDIFHTAIEMFGFNGIIGAKGRMRCKAAALPPLVEWGIYHTK